MPEAPEPVRLAVILMTSFYYENRDIPDMTTYKAIKQGIGDGFISCGNTGALLAGATFITGRIKNVDRASLSAVIPSLKGGFILSDVGANVDCTPEFLKTSFSHQKG